MIWSYLYLTSICHKIKRNPNLSAFADSVEEASEAGRF